MSTHSGLRPGHHAPTLLRGENIIIFSSDDWDSGLKTSKYHIARQLARHNRVLFVNSIGLRAPTAGARDIGRALRKLGSFLCGARKVPEGLHIYTPIVVPFFRGSSPIKAINGVLLRLVMRWLTFRLRLFNPIVFAFLPTFNDVVGTLGEKAIFYYCIDDMRGYRGVDLDWFSREEERLLLRANCTISSARQLTEEFRARGYRAYYVPHGVDWVRFRTALDDDLPLPEDMRDIPAPRLGFYGFLSDEWIDYPLLKRMAGEHPDWHIVLIGRPKAGMDMATLLPEPNIHYLGLKSFDQLPAYTRHFDVGLIPFGINPLTLHSNPLKLLEYLAGGLPVVVTDIPEARAYQEAVRIARSQEEYIAQCWAALQDNTPSARERRSRLAQEHSWEKRIEAISEIVCARILV
jgi:glycosyltransferase involved in cell wall biosynthesis